MTSMVDCYESVMTISLGSLCLEPAVDQGVWRKNMPTTKDWVKANWYVFFVVALVIVLALIAITLSAIRWCRRIEHRHRREERNKRVDGMLRLVTASFHGTLSRKGSVASSRRRHSGSDETDNDHSSTHPGNSDEDSPRGAQGGAKRTMSIRRTTSRHQIRSNSSTSSTTTTTSSSDDDTEKSEDRQRPQSNHSSRAGSRSAPEGGPRRSSKSLLGGLQVRAKGRRPKK